MERLMKFTALGVAWIAWGCGSGNTAVSEKEAPLPNQTRGKGACTEKAYAVERTR